MDEQEIVISEELPGVILDRRHIVASRGKRYGHVENIREIPDIAAVVRVQPVNRIIRFKIDVGAIGHISSEAVYATAPIRISHIVRAIFCSNKGRVSLDKIL